MPSVFCDSRTKYSTMMISMPVNTVLARMLERAVETGPANAAKTMANANSGAIHR
ncbi:MAG: hypothetical protein ACLSVD_19140 [Eggerthellaceae bacterium]